MLYMTYGRDLPRIYHKSGSHQSRLGYSNRSSWFNGDNGDISKVSVIGLIDRAVIGLIDRVLIGLMVRVKCDWSGSGWNMKGRRGWSVSEWKVCLE